MKQIIYFLLSLFVIYLMTLSIDQIICHLMVGRLMNDGGDTTGISADLLKLLTRHSTWMEETMKNLKQARWCLG
jgi:hypothetical protein